MNKLFISSLQNYEISTLMSNNFLLSYKTALQKVMVGFELETVAVPCVFVTSEPKC